MGKVRINQLSHSKVRILSLAPYQRFLEIFSGFWNVVLEKTLESPLDCKEIQPVHPKGNQSWIFSGRTDAEAETPIFWPPDYEELIHLKRPWCWERLRVGGKEDDRGWDGWMASPTQWTSVWVNSGSWWWSGRPGMLQYMGSQESDATEQLNWTELKARSSIPKLLRKTYFKYENTNRSLKDYTIPNI